MHDTKEAQPDSQQDPRPYLDLLDLVRLCPGEVPDVKRGGTATISITGTRRLLLWALAQHADGKTDVTYVGERTLRAEIQCDRTTLIRGARALKDAGLVTATQRLSSPGHYSTNVWTINRRLLLDLVGPKQDDAGLVNALDLLRREGEVRVTTKVARKEQVKSTLYRLAGEMQIVITEDGLYNGSVTLLVRPAPEAKMIAEPVDLAAESDPPDLKASAATTTTKPEPLKRKVTSSVPVAVIDAITALPHIGEKLAPTDAASLAAGLVQEFGEDGALTALRLLPDNTLLIAAGRKNPAGYLRVCARSEFKRDLECRLRDFLGEAKSYETFVMKIPPTVSKTLVEYMSRTLTALAGTEFNVGPIQPYLDEPGCDRCIELTLRSRATQKTDPDADLQEMINGSDFSDLITDIDDLVERESDGEDRSTAA